MSFPITVTAHIDSQTTNNTREIILHKGLTTLIGPNGSGKTHLLRSLKMGLQPYVTNKKIRFLSAGLEFGSGPCFELYHSVSNDPLRDDVSFCSSVR